MHICCGPCAIYPFDNLIKEGFDIEGFFYNPNIQPKAEYDKRKEATENFGKIFKAKLHFGDYQEEAYSSCTSLEKDKNARCRSCFKLRLQETHRFALNNKFDFFTTTLLVSPYQDQQSIKELGETMAGNSMTKFLFCDFRPGFKEAHMKAKELNLYCQKYCGCLKSIEERNNSKKIQKCNC